MLGGLGQTSLAGSKGNLRGPTSGAGAVSAFFRFAALPVIGKPRSAASSTTPLALRVYFEFKRKRNIFGLHKLYLPDRVVSFMFSRFLWQVSQNAMLLTWSFASRSGCAEACG